MRIAVTGTHGSGKTTLIDDFVDAHPDYEREQEPYWAMVQSGIPFADGVSMADLEEQLAASVKLILGHADSPDVIFDRCPIDFIAYLEVVGEQGGTEWEPSGKLLSGIEKALERIDLLAFVPLVRPDEIRTAIEFPGLRQRVDARLKTIMRDDALELLGQGPKIVELAGSRDERVRKLSRAIGR
jgi:hypothetical protein